ncbi:flagellar motor protein [Enterovibrio sp. ZSDZ35]|uniref:Flagellar motor protein n=1 Tax=Enterovibrio qingdaonensis TaxID=2899818 RepID=A0ABT5QGR6_9GAMM|nr:flagellar motor protein [Enterovibrio sp. ZSDZ35]MDD1780156.1 flagellar motor protein [Enterovibrio sp. ZSDZ35]
MSFIGVIVAVMFILVANLLEGGHISGLINAPAFLIVIGGTIGAILVQFSFSSVKLVFTYFSWLWMPPLRDSFGTAKQMVDLAVIARRDGLLALEIELEKVQDPFLLEALQMLVDGLEKDAILDVMENKIAAEEQRIGQVAKIYEAMGGYSPTMGILGAVLGLIHAMGLLDKPDQLGAGIAVAFVATIYGVAFANIVFLPFGNRYKAFSYELTNYRQMVLEGVSCIATGSNAIELQSRLGGYVAHPMFVKGAS